MLTRNKILRALAGLITFALASMSAQAIVISGTEVGSVDTLRCKIDSANSGQTYESTELSACVGQSVTLVNNINSFTVVSGGGYRYLNVSPNSPGFFLLKFGNGNGTYDMFFFENLSNYNYLVWSDAVMLANGITSNHLTSLSHYTYGGGTSKVPEPGSLALLGLSLLGFGFMGRARKDS